MGFNCNEHMWLQNALVIKNKTIKWLVAKDITWHGNQTNNHKPIVVNLFY